MKRFIYSLSIIIIGICTMGCSYVSYSIPENAIPVSQYLSSVQRTEDGAICVFTEEFPDGTTIYAPKGYCKLEGESGNSRYLVNIGGIETSCSFEEAMRLLDSDWEELCDEYPETVLSIKDVMSFFETVELDADNYLDYIGFREVETKNEITGYSADYRKKYRPYDYMINEYVGPGKLLTDYCEKISCSGTVDREVTIRIYDLDYRLCSSQIDSETSGKAIEFSNSYSAVYLGDEDSYTIHFTPYMDPLESWYIKTFSNGLKEVHQTLVEISNIQITEASGKLIIFMEPSAEQWSSDAEEKQYIAVKDESGVIARYYNSEDIIALYADNTKE